MGVTGELGFGGSLGLFSKRDKDKSCFRIFIALVRDLKTEHKGMTSDELATSLHLTRGTVIHHLNKLMQSGIVTSENNKYALRVERLSELVDLVEKDIHETLTQLRTVATDIDKQLRL